jgi:hypothetical protein
LSYKEFSGSIHAAIGQLTSLTALCVFELAHHFRNSFFFASNTRQLFNMQLVGTIPSTIGQLTALTTLCVVVSTASGAHLLDFRYLFNNKLTGQIPPTIGQLTAIEYLCVSDLFERKRRGELTYLATLPQGSLPKQFDRTHSVDDWTIDGTSCLVNAWWC